MSRFVSLTALAVLIAAPGAEARDTARNSIEGYVIERAVIRAPNCEGSAFDDVRIEAFEKGVCQFHQPARSAEQLDRVLKLLNRAQVQGLPVVHQQLAGFLTGLGHCATAERHLDTFRGSGNADLTARDNFCAARMQSQAELNAIRWDFALFDYAEDLGVPNTLDTRLGEMASCYSGVLAPGFDAECGLITNITETELNVFVDEATDAVVQTYFTGVESPITAMFQRKRERAEGVLAMAGASIQGLKDGAAAVNAEYIAYHSAYETERDAKMTPIYENYRESILRATAILDEFNRWKEGLFMTSDNVNLLPKIVERGVELTEELARVETDDYAARAGKLVDDVRAVVQSEAEHRALIGQLCRVYFCELASRRRMIATQHVCRQPALTNNPICLNAQGQMKGGDLQVNFDGEQRIGVADFCRAAGIDDVFLTVGLSPATALTCMGQMP